MSIERLVLKLRHRFTITKKEEAALENARSEVSRYPAREIIIVRGEELHRSTLLVSGFACRYKDLADGRRQILELHVPGDFVDLHAFQLKTLEHNIAAMSPIETVWFAHEGLHEITETMPRLTRILWFSTLLDAAIHREWILSVGRRSAVARLAHLLCELYLRLEVVGLAGEGRFSLPLTQIDLADACGLTPVHVNRMIQELRREGLISFKNGDVAIHDWGRLGEVADFNSDYLYLDRRPEDGNE
ncbi:MAG: Crp/Fnr family transcriptional regulator [Sphingomonadaceae bacterium]